MQRQAGRSGGGCSAARQALARARAHARVLCAHVRRDGGVIAHAVVGGGHVLGEDDLAAGVAGRGAGAQVGLGIVGTCRAAQGAMGGVEQVVPGAAGTLAPCERPLLQTHQLRRCAAGATRARGRPRTRVDHGDGAAVADEAERRRLGLVHQRLRLGVEHVAAAHFADRQHARVVLERVERLSAVDRDGHDGQLTKVVDDVTGAGAGRGRGDVCEDAGLDGLRCARARGAHRHDARAAAAAGEQAAAGRGRDGEGYDKVGRLPGGDAVERGCRRGGRGGGERGIGLRGRGCERLRLGPRGGGGQCGGGGTVGAVGGARHHAGEGRGRGSCEYQQQRRQRQEGRGAARLSPLNHRAVFDLLCLPAVRRARQARGGKRETRPAVDGSGKHAATRRARNSNGAAVPGARGRPGALRSSMLTVGAPEMLPDSCTKQRPWSWPGYQRPSLFKMYDYT